MKKKISIGFILIFFLAACISSTNNSAPKTGVQLPLDKTRDDSAMQTIIALEEATETPTPTPTGTLKPPNPWAELATPSASLDSAFTGSAFATAIYQNSIIYQGPSTNYRMACYVAKGTQLIITGRNNDSTWLSVILGRDQTCITMIGNIIRADLVPDPRMQFWILPSSYTISGDLSAIPRITPAPTWSYYVGKGTTPTIEVPPPSK